MVWAALLGRLGMGALKFAGTIPGQTAIGAGFGYFGSDYENPNLRMQDAIKGAVGGAAFGAAFRFGPGVLKGIGKRAFATDKLRQAYQSGSGGYMGILSGSPVGGAARFTGRAGMGAARFAGKHPFLTGGAIGGAYMAIGGQAYESPTLTGATVDVRYNKQTAAANELMMGAIAPTGMIGSAQQMMGPMHRTMIQSTYGLTQGLHRGRHG